MKKHEINDWLFDLFLKREILEDFEDPIQDLMKLCRSDSEFALMRHAIEHLVILNNAQFSRHIDNLVGHIENYFSSDESLAVVAMAWDEGADSSQLVVQLMKPALKNASHIKLFNSVPQFVKKNYLQEYPRYVLVDDFSGTGNTVLNRIKHIENAAKGKGIDVSSNAYLMFGMEAAFNVLRGNGINIHFGAKLKAGISGYFSVADQASKYAEMKRLEEELAPLIGTTSLPSMGHGNAEAMFFIQGYNAPNSNFPIFWWPFDARNKNRDTLMNRYEL